MSNMVQLVKQAATEAVDAGKPVQILFGTVISADPLQIQVDSKVTYTEKMLILTRNVTDYEADIEVSHITEEDTHSHTCPDGTTSDYTHYHDYTGRKKIKIYNALVEGDQVVLARVQQGKRYLVIDRIEPVPELTGEWI